MKFFKLSIAVCVAGLSLSSCETINNLFKKNKEKEVTQEVILPQDREKIHEQDNTATYNPKELEAGAISGDWAIEDVFGQPAVGEKAPYLKFVESEKRMFGNNGCNTINATYSCNPADSTLIFDNFITTMMFCNKPGLTDIDINTAIASTRFYTWEEDENSFYHLSFYDENHHKLMGLLRQNFDFLDGAWKVTEINDEPVKINNMKLVFDVDEHKIHGNTGCNVMNGDFFTDRDTPNSISFEGIAVTMMLCPQMEYQTALLVALEEAEKAKPVNKDQVWLLDSNGKKVLTLTRTDEK